MCECVNNSRLRQHKLASTTVIETRKTLFPVHCGRVKELVNMRHKIGILCFVFTLFVSQSCAQGVFGGLLKEAKIEE